MRETITLIMALLTCSIYGQQVIPLYDGKPPGSENWNYAEGLSEENIFNNPLVYNVSEPTLEAYLPPYYLATGTAIVIAPGGAFHVLSIENEGRTVAKWLQSKGVAAFVLKYRTARSHTDDPAQELMAIAGDQKAMDARKRPIVPLAMQDGMRAIQYVRAHAADWDIDPNRIGMMGFSAGATLTMSVAYNAEAAARPNFLAPIYINASTVIGSELPPEKTPIFIAVAGDDQLRLVPHSIALFEKWHHAGQPASLHIYEKGGHGFGMRQQNIPTDTWYERFGDWLKLQGYLKKLYPNKYEILYGQEAVGASAKQKIIQMQTDYAQRSRYAAANKALEPPAADDYRVVFLGNSITEAWAKEMPAFFETHNFIGRGISGQTSSQLLLRFQQDVIDLQPKAVVIHIGTNDIAENTGPYDPAFTMNNIISMTQLAEANNIKVILASVLPHTKFEWNRALGNRSDMIIDLNNRIQVFAQKNNITYIDYHGAMKNTENGMDPDLAEDGVHPTTKGFELMRNLVLQAFDQIKK